MKNVLKSSLSIFLAITIILSSAYVGLNEVDFSEIKFDGINFSGVSQFLKAITPDFSVESQAASSGTCGENLTWELDDEGTLTISGTGEMDDYDVSAKPWKVSGIKKIVINDGVTYIGFEAFWDCNTLESVTLPDTLTRIGGCAFESCINLTSINIPNSVTSIGRCAFRYCSSLSRITIHKNIISIESGAFEECDNLKDVYITDIESWCNIDFYDTQSNPLCYADNLYLNGELVTEVVIPEGVTTIPAGAFANSNIIEITIPNSVTSIDYSAFRGTGIAEITIPDSVTSIGADAFRYCRNLTSVTIGNGLMSIGSYAFADCDNLVSMTIPDSVTSIGAYAFSRCKNLMSIEIPDGVTNIAFHTFEYCDSLMTVTIGSGVTSIGDCAFFYCNSLTSLIIPEGVSDIGEWAIYNCTSLTSIEIPDSVKNIGEGAFGDCESLASVKIGANVTSIPDSAFCDCTSLTSIEIPDSVTAIEGSAFRGCIRLASVTIGNNVKSIGGQAFEECESLVSIIIPDSVTHIESSAFIDCRGLVSVDIPDSVTTLGGTIFAGCTSLTAINVSDGNKSYSSVDGVVYNKKQTILVIYPEGKSNTSYKIPDTVINLQDYVFRNPKFSTIIIGRGLTNIKSDTFRRCGSLRSVVIPLETKYISGNAFPDNESLKDVFYEGSESQWNSVSIASGNASLTNTKIHYNVVIENWGNHYGEPVTKQEPSCTESGLYTYICPCGYEKTEELSKLPHNYSDEWTIDSEAGCKSSGSKSHHCLTCDRKTDVTTIPATGVHTPSEWYIEYNATCSREGSKYKHCTDCWEILERETIPKTEHNPSAWYLEKGATVNSAGSKYKMCIDCWKILERESIPQLKCSKPKLKTIANTEYGVKITWGSVDGADSYRVYRKTSKSDWKYLGSTSKTGYTDKTAKSGTKYYYAVRARNEAGNSSLSSSLSKLYLADPTLKTPSSTKSGVALEWNKISGADGYYVYRKTGSGSYKKIATVKGYKKVKYTDKSAKKGKTYTYKVKAYKSKTYSAYSNAKKIKDKY